MSILSRLKSRVKTRVPPNLWSRLQRIRLSCERISDKTLAPFFRPVLSRLVLLKLKASRSKQIDEYFAKNPVRKVQLGAGSNNLPGWLNSEGFVPSSFTHSLNVAKGYIFLDVCEPFPFEDNSVDYIFHEHVIEHLTYFQGKHLLNECFRVLKPGGRLRSATPDLEAFVGLYGNNTSAEQKFFLSEYIRFNSGIWSPDLAHVRSNEAAFVLNHAVRAWGHLFIYDYQTLSASTMAAGFVGINRQSPQRSPDAHLSNLEFRKEIVGNFDALIVEASKPPLRS